ncbi:MAG TPA: hypothetical protein VGQ59_05815 [Cyclobacteriaceae bacterium]|jgi:hypothetical protein|nr:hypothetical protein [Cyclobacteriaceae bacterium]
MTFKEEKEWKKNYVAGKSTLFITIRCDSFGYFDHNEFVKHKKKTNWEKEIDKIGASVNKDLENAKNCLRD